MISPGFVAAAALGHRAVKNMTMTARITGRAASRCLFRGEYATNAVIHESIERLPGAARTREEEPNAGYGVSLLTRWPVSASYAALIVTREQSRLPAFLGR